MNPDPQARLRGSVALPSHPASDSHFHTRDKPAQGVIIDLARPTIVLVTVCTKDRVKWLACDEAHRLLLATWQKADAWLVGRYVLMPDHLHLLAAPRDLRFTIERWLAFWKSRFSKSHSNPVWLGQAHAFHHRLRADDDYTQKWHYVRDNPLRAGLATDADAWPYQGELNVLRW